MLPHDQVAGDGAQEQEVRPDGVEREGGVGRREPVADGPVAAVEVDEAEGDGGAGACHICVDALALADVRALLVRNQNVNVRLVCLFFLLARKVFLFGLNIF